MKLPSPDNVWLQFLALVLLLWTLVLLLVAQYLTAPIGSW